MSAAFSAADVRFMRLALRLSEEGRGFTEPNPLVGAVVVKRGRILATGFHRACGLDHAETMALQDVSENCTTLYVTLEPCGHFGKTPPCTELILRRQVKRVVVAMVDPNPLVNGRGIARLRQAGVRVEVGLLAEDAARLNRHYLKFVGSGIPYITLRAGLSLDGKLTDKFFRSRWLTSSLSRRISHSLRGEYSAILAGRHTVEVDNPRLTVRGPEWREKRLYRVVLDAENALDQGLALFRGLERFPLILFSANDQQQRQQKVQHHFFVSRASSGLALPEVCRKLGQLGIASLLVEGGGQVIDSFLRQNLADEVVFFVSPKLVGGRQAVTPFASGVENLARALKLKRTECLAIGSDFIIRGDC